ncbi:hypothetical protein CCZ01_00900 [Helicobacter monodelphidis]|uniref:HAD family hydrolase n=1 Tax=Helicobacter sp. 15-1451 TaxID=2004995 RepID=UPI000DCB64C0|nr:HAD hydrolase-like protein [Helicobacter sp. 15-1451]RAX59324.1 hypothetical protein CCZ01_00900 [Helicobacter sp. 15-1451]
MLEFRAVIWDFDGVILDALPVRTEAFLYALREYSQEALEEFKCYHLQNGGISRFVKISHFFEKIIKQPCPETLKQKILSDFHRVVHERLFDSSLLIIDSISYIQEHFSHLEFYIASGSEQEELRSLCDFLQISRYFKGIYGSPTPKVQWVEKIVQNSVYDTKEFVLIGDSMGDYESARRNHISFLGYNNPNLKSVGQYILSFNPLCFAD